MIFKGKLTLLDGDGNPVMAQPTESIGPFPVTKVGPIDDQGYTQIEFEVPTERVRAMGLLPDPAQFSIAPKRSWEDLVE